MSNSKNDKEEVPIKDMKARQREFIEKLFGKPNTSNIWGKKFSIFSFFFLLTVTGIAIYGVQTGKINMEEQFKSDPFDWSKQHPAFIRKDTVSVK